MGWMVMPNTFRVDRARLVSNSFKRLSQVVHTIDRHPVQAYQEGDKSLVVYEFEGAFSLEIKGRDDSGYVVALGIDSCYGLDEFVDYIVVPAFHAIGKSNRSLDVRVLHKAIDMWRELIRHRRLRGDTEWLGPAPR